MLHLELGVGVGGGLNDQPCIFIKPIFIVKLSDPGILGVIYGPMGWLRANVYSCETFFYGRTLPY